MLILHLKADVFPVNSQATLNSKHLITYHAQLCFTEIVHWRNVYLVHFLAKNAMEISSRSALPANCNNFNKFLIYIKLL
jgi:hypothetical protein